VIVGDDQANGLWLSNIHATTPLFVVFRIVVGLPFARKGTTVPYRKVRSTFYSPPLNLWT
jgi:hypothetical protein